MAYESGSTKASAGMLVGFCVFFMYGFLFNIFMKKNNLIGSSASIFFVAAFLAIIGINWEYFFSKGNAFFVGADTGGAREFFYGYAIKRVQDSLFFGFGPGPHILNMDGRFWDAHQTYLTALLQGGIFGLFCFLFFVFLFFKKIKRFPSFVACFSSILLYASGGDILRRSPIWILVILMYLLSFENRPLLRPQNYKIH
jgi:O-antigen ligase